MKRASILAFLTAVMCVVAPLGLSAQTGAVSSVADRYVISARAGGVGYVEGPVNVIRVNGTSGILLKRDQVAVGDQVTTGAGGRAEILLNPGSYLRLGGNSSFEFGATDLEDLTIKLNSGSAMFEVFAADEFRVSVFTPKGKVSLIESGIYRVDVAPDGSALASVTKGKAEIGEGNPVIVKDGRTGTLNGGAVAIAKFDKDKRDDLAEWSRNRSKELVKINSTLNDRTLDSALARGFLQGFWGLRDSIGLWIFDYRSGSYCFLPYGFNWRSPYGGWYGNGIYPAYVPLGPVRSGKGRRVSAVESVRSGNSAGVTPMSRVKGSRTERANNVDPLPITKVGRGSRGSVFTENFPSTKGFDDFSGPSRSTGGSFPSAPAPISVVPMSRSKGN